MYTKMDFRRVFIAIAALAVCFAVPSCKKDEDEDDELKNYFSGTLDFNAPAYANPGDVITMTPSGTHHREDNGNVGYFWTASPLSKKNDTTRFVNDPAGVDGSFTLNIPDTLCTVTLMVAVFSDDYYTSMSQNRYLTIVDPKKTLTEIEYPQSKIIDSRDGREYPYFTACGVDWLAKNMAYEGSGMAFRKEKAVNDIYGRYYSWEEAMAVCPEGWRLPTEEDWKHLAECLKKEIAKDGSIMDVSGMLMANAYFNLERMWEYWPEVKITNSTGFSAIPTGYAFYTADGADFAGLGFYSAYWTATEVDDERAYYRNIYLKEPDVHLAIGHKNGFATSVRCVRD